MAKPLGAAEVRFQDYARMVWRRKTIVLVTAIIAVVVAVGVDSRKASVYQGTAALLLTPEVSQAVSAASGGGGGVLTVDAPTAVNVIESQATQQAAAQLLKLPYVPGATAAEEGSTSVVSISVRSTNPSLAAKVANAYANAYIAQQRAQAVDSLLSASTQIASKIATLDTQLAATQNQVNIVTSQEVPAPVATGVEGLPVPTPVQTAQIAALTLQETALNDQEVAFKQQLGQLQVNANLAGGGGRILTEAAISRTPVSPDKVRDALLALVIGLVLGVGLALLRDLQDDRIRTEDDLRRAVGGLPAVGIIPTVEEWGDRVIPKLVSMEAPTSAAAESYRELRTALQFMSLDKPIRSIVITSPATGDGKTTTLANLAVNMASAGQRVVAVCCDLRRPRLHEFFGLSNTVGLTSVLLGETTLVDAIQLVAGCEGLSVLASGPIPPNPSELLSSRPAINLMTALGDMYDMVLFDTPPVLPVTDATVVAARADAVLLVAWANGTTRRGAARAVELLGRVDTPLVGVVVNNVPRSDAGYGYGSRYGYGYGYKSKEHRYEPLVVGSAENFPNGSNASVPNGKVSVRLDHGTNSALSTEAADESSDGE